MNTVDAIAHETLSHKGKSLLCNRFTRSGAQSRVPRLMSSVVANLDTETRNIVKSTHLNPTGIPWYLFTRAVGKRGSDMDPMGHPDLVRLGRSLRNRLDDTLDAEQAAARAAARRRRTLRDRLLDSEDRTENVVLTTADVHLHRGIVDAVGVDHVVIVDGDIERSISIAHIVTVEAR